MIRFNLMDDFPAKHAKHTKHTKSMPDEATVLRTSGCPAIDGLKGSKPFGRLALGTPPSAARPAFSPAWTKDRPGSLAPARNEVTRKAVRKGAGGKHGFPAVFGWTDDRADVASTGGRRDASLFRMFHVFRGKHHPTTFCCRKPRWQVNCNNSHSKAILVFL